jgi:hypothetical protein
MLSFHSLAFSLPRALSLILFLPGTYGAAAGLAACAACSPGTFAARNGTGAEGCDSCGAGSYQVI